MASNEKSDRTVSAAGPHRQDWRQLGRNTKETFNQVARAKEADAQEKQKSGDSAHHRHDLEPSQQEKKAGAALDKSAANSLLQQQKTREFARTRSKDVGLNI